MGVFEQRGGSRLGASPRFGLVLFASKPCASLALILFLLCPHSAQAGARDRKIQQQRRQQQAADRQRAAMAQPSLSQNSDVASTAEQPAAPTAAPGQRRVVKLDIPQTLLQRGRYGKRQLSLPGPLKAFMVGMLHIANIPRRFPLDFSAPWVKEEGAFTELDRGRQVALLQQILEVIVQVYKDPQQYAGPPINTLEEYVAAVSPTQGDPSNSVAQEFEHYVTLLRKGLQPASRVVTSGENNDFNSAEVRTLAMELEYQNEIYLRAALKSMATASLDGGSASYVIEVLIGGFVGALVQNPTSSTAEFLDIITDIYEGKPVGKPTPNETQTVSSDKVVRGLRAFSGALRAATDYPNAEKVFLQFVEKLADLGKRDKHALANIIAAFEKALEKVVDVFGEEASRLAASNEIFGGSTAQKAKQGALLRLFLQRYPLLLPQDVLKDIILDQLVMPLRPDVNQMMDVVLGHAGPLLKNFLQTRTQVARSGGLLQNMANAAQDSGRPIPLPELRRLLEEDPNRYLPPDVVFMEISEDIAKHLSAGKPSTCLDPNDKGAGKFFVTYRVLIDGREKILKVRRPEAQRRLTVDREIFRYLAAEIGRYFLPLGRDASPEVVKTRMLREVDMRTDAMMEETSAEVTVVYQQEARKRFEGKEKTLTTSEGDVKVIYHVPDVADAEPGSEMLLMDYVKGARDIRSDLVKSFPGIAKAVAEDLYGEFFEELIWVPLQRAEQETEDVQHFGIANRDGHAGNVMIVVNSVPGHGYEVHVHLLDWGMTSFPSVADLDQILALAFGGGVNSPKIITKMLWELSNQGRDQSANQGVTQEIRARTVEAKRKLYTYVKGKVAELNANWSYWGPEAWIFNVWLHGLLQFPPYLASLNDAITALDDTVITLYDLKQTPEDVDPRESLDLKVMNRLESRGRWPAYHASQGRFPVATPVLAAASIVRTAARSCGAGLLAMVGAKKIREPVDPNE